MYKNDIRMIISMLCILGFSPMYQGCAQQTSSAQNNKSSVRTLVSAEQIEVSGQTQYQEIIKDAQQKQKLLGQNHPTYQRILRIAQQLIPYANTVNNRANNWKWEVNVMQDNDTNAFCMPGGKIAIFTGIIDKLNLTDAEIAVVLGHEMAHALQEHAREQMAKSQLTDIGANLIGNVLGLGDLGRVALNAGAGLLSLRFSRDDETDADFVGLRLSTQAGYDPRASIVLWEKMIKTNKGAPPQWLSTHPVGQNRIQALKNKMPEMMPVFAQIKPNLARLNYKSNTQGIADVGI
jgi:predicted Zn-dependent protease